jgi:hypothetical protein
VASTNSSSFEGFWLVSAGGIVARKATIKKNTIQLYIGTNPKAKAK